VYNESTKLTNDDNIAFCVLSSVL